MKLPKTVKIGEVAFDVSTTREHNGGRGHVGNQTIVVGTKYNKKDRQFTTLVHEIAECSCHLRRVSYISDDNDIKFVMTHREFEDFTGDIASAIMPMLDKKYRV